MLVEQGYPYTYIQVNPSSIETNDVTGDLSPLLNDIVETLKPFGVEPKLYEANCYYGEEYMGYDVFTGEMFESMIADDYFLLSCTDSMVIHEVKRRGYMVSHNIVYYLVIPSDGPRYVAASDGRTVKIIESDNGFFEGAVDLYAEDAVDKLKEYLLYSGNRELFPNIRCKYSIPAEEFVDKKQSGEVDAIPAFSYEENL